MNVSLDGLNLTTEQLCQAMVRLGYSAELATEAIKSVLAQLRPYTSKNAELKYIRLFNTNNWLKMHGYPKRRMTDVRRGRR